MAPIGLRVAEARRKLALKGTLLALFVAVAGFVAAPAQAANPDMKICSWNPDEPDNCLLAPDGNPDPDQPDTMIICPFDGHNCIL